MTHGVRPGTALTTKVGNYAQILSDLGGLDVDWSIYSRVDDVARKVEHWWVDDEWDIQRSRGLRPEVRVTGNVSG